jgi:hypothetical protein
MISGVLEQKGLVAAQMQTQLKQKETSDRFDVTRHCFTGFVSVLSRSEGVGHAVA